jgi:hypothetical protein
MNKSEAIEDAKKNFNMTEWLQGERDARDNVPHVSGTESYNAGYSHGIWKLEQASGVYG